MDNNINKLSNILKLGEVVKYNFNNRRINNKFNINMAGSRTYSTSSVINSNSKSNLSILETKGNNNVNNLHSSPSSSLSLASNSNSHNNIGKAKGNKKGYLGYENLISICNMTDVIFGKKKNAKKRRLKILKF